MQLRIKLAIWPTTLFDSTHNYIALYAFVTIFSISLSVLGLWELHTHSLFNTPLVCRLIKVLSHAGTSVVVNIIVISYEV